MSGTPDWSQGYVTDTLYTENHYREMSPAWINYVAVLNGCLPRSTDRDFAYLELGCGHGRTLTHLAAAYPKGRFFGVDFNPAHIDSAQRYAAALGIANVRFLECGFKDLVGEVTSSGVGQNGAGQNGTGQNGTGQGGAGRRAATELPDVDFIALHGVYSWIGAAARQAVQRIIFERLKPGGLVYNSYNCLPGWAAEAPIRRLFLEFAAIEPGGSAARMQQALRRAGELQALKLGYLARNPVADRSISQHLQRRANYMAHEYLNAEWNLFYSIDVAAEMAAAKLDYVGAAHLVENHLDLLFNDEAAAFVRKQPTLPLQQLMQDFLINQRFRRDIFVRGHARLGRAAIAAQLRQQCFLPVKPLAEIGAKLKVPRGDVSFEGDIPAILAKAFGANALSLGELTEAYRQAGGKPTGLERIVGILAATGIIAPAAQPHRPPKAYAPPARLLLRLQANQHLLQQAMGRLGRNAANTLLVAPVLGGVIPLSPVNTVILSEMLAGGTVDELAERSMASVERHGLALQTEGEMGTDPAVKRAQLASMIRNFAAGDLGLLLRSGVADIA